MMGQGRQPLLPKGPRSYFTLVLRAQSLQGSSEALPRCWTELKILINTVRNSDDFTRFTLLRPRSWLSTYLILYPSGLILAVTEITMLISLYGLSKPRHGRRERPPGQSWPRIHQTRWSRPRPCSARAVASSQGSATTARAAGVTLGVRDAS